MATHGRTGLSHLVMGSIAERMVVRPMPGVDHSPKACYSVARGWFQAERDVSKRLRLRTSGSTRG